MDQLGLKVSEDERQYIYQQIDNITDNRSEKSQRADDSKRARKTYKYSNIRGLNAWIRDPNRIDIEGIDAFNKSKKAKRKKRKTKSKTIKKRK